MRLCQYPGCDADRAAHEVACWRHWAVVSGRTRRLVVLASRRKADRALRDALTAAVVEMNEHAHRLGVSA